MIQSSQIPASGCLNVLEKIKQQCSQTYLDFALSHHLLKSGSLAEPAATALICHLSQALKAGHLCVKVNHMEVFPLPEHIWDIDDDVMSEENWKELKELIQSGTIHIPRNLISSVSSESLPNDLNTPLCRCNDLYYFQKYWIQESSCLNSFKRLCEQTPHLQLDPSHLQIQLQNIYDKGLLLDEQAQAIAQLGNNSVIIISGGPGTGKTYTAGLLIQTFCNSLSIDQRLRCKISLAAPTGKAAANLQTSLSKSMTSITGFNLQPAQTLHALLGLKTQGNKTTPKLIADLLIIDECSMIDIHMMSSLLKALKPGARLILLGDPYQLPPVEAGSFFSDMTHLVANSHQVELKKCLRTDLLEIVELANDIKNGDCKAALRRIKLSDGALHLEPIPNNQRTQETLKKLKERVWPYFEDLLNPHEQSLNFNRFRILSPLRKGSLGIHQLNAFLYQESIKNFQKQPTHLLAIPIMITANSAKRELYNGDVGYLFKQSPDEGLQVGDYALFGNKKIPALLLPRYEYAYCLSVHKSQGSEFDEVLFLIPEGAERFGRELIYTGVTRARKKIEIWTDEAIFETILSNTSSRLSIVESNRLSLAKH